MNTQSHAIINVALLSRKAAPYLHRYALIGAVLPDVPMFIFFAVEAFVLKHPQNLDLEESGISSQDGKTSLTSSTPSRYFSSFLGSVTGANPVPSSSAP